MMVHVGGGRGGDERVEWDSGVFFLGLIKPKAKKSVTAIFGLTLSNASSTTIQLASKRKIFPSQ